LYGKPTTINNTETFAAVPWIIRNGGAAYLECGKPNNGGTKIFSVSGDVETARQLRDAHGHAVCQAA
jgi:NADH-quinone oxidoreductase subunit F